VRSVFSDEKISPTVVTPLHRAARARCAAAVTGLFSKPVRISRITDARKEVAPFPRPVPVKMGSIARFCRIFRMSGCPPIASRTATAKIFTLGRTPQRRRLCVRLRTIGALREIYASCQQRPKCTQQKGCDNRTFAQLSAPAVALSNRSQNRCPLLRDTFHCSTRYKRHRLGTPLSRWTPRSLKRIPDCDIRSLTALETRISPARAFAATRAPT
jgi:hypothetical protein